MDFNSIDMKYPSRISTSYYIKFILKLEDWFIIIHYWKGSDMPNKHNSSTQNSNFEINFWSNIEWNFGAAHFWIHLNQNTLKPTHHEVKKSKMSSEF